MGSRAGPKARARGMGRSAGGRRGQTPARAAARAAAAEPPAPAGEPAGEASAVELLGWDAGAGRFRLNPEALRALRGLEGPVCPVAVCGRARQGKSFVLNQLLGRTSGFAVAPTTRPCTKGLWMWARPVPHVAPDGTPCSLVLLDSEGIDAYDQTGQYSAQIFSLAVLLSSTFVYNQMGGIDEAALDRLSLVTEMTKRIRVRAADEGPAAAAEEEEELGRHSPAFIWLLRDFFLDLEEDFGPHGTARDYLEAALAEAPGAGPSVAAKNEIRRSIKGLFPDRDCVTLVRPHNDERQLRRLEALAPEELRPEFRAGMTGLLDKIFAAARPKVAGGVVLTGGLLAGLAEAYVGAINAGAVPTIAGAWQAVAEAENRKAVERAFAAFAAAFDRSTAADEPALQAALAAARARAEAVFGAEAVGEGPVLAGSRAALEARVAAFFAEFRERRLAEAELDCKLRLQEAGRAVAAAAKQPDATLPGLLGRLDAALGAYDAEASGPSKHALRSAFVREALADGAEALMERVLAKAKEVAQQAKLGQERHRLKLATAEEAAEHWRAQHEAAAGRATALTEELHAAKVANGRQEAALQQLKGERLRLDQRRLALEHEVQLLQDSQGRAGSDVKALQAERSEISRERAKLIVELSQAKAELEEAKAKGAELAAAAATAAGREAETRAALEALGGAGAPAAYDSHLASWSAEATAAARTPKARSPPVPIPSPSPTPKAQKGRGFRPGAFFAPVGGGGAAAENAAPAGQPPARPVVSKLGQTMDLSKLTVAQLRERILRTGLQAELDRLGKRPTKAALLGLCRSNAAALPFRPLN